MLTADYKFVRPRIENRIMCCALRTQFRTCAANAFAAKESKQFNVRQTNHLKLAYLQQARESVEAGSLLPSAFCLLPPCRHSPLAGAHSNVPGWNWLQANQYA